MNVTARPGPPGIGILVVDDQHRALLEMIRRLEQAMAEGQGGEAIPGLLRDLNQYAGFHFGTEERLMQSFGYPLADTHAIQHGLMVAALRQAELGFVRGDSRAPLQFLDLMTDWLDNHIATWDVPLGSFLNDRGVT
jgi:hemerythrin-like metal-binding protein